MTDEEFESMGPPWVLFSDGGKPVAILPAMRPGEVADVRGLPIDLVTQIIRCANAAWYRGEATRMAELAATLERLGAKLPPDRDTPDENEPSPTSLARFDAKPWLTQETS